MLLDWTNISNNNFDASTKFAIFFVIKSFVNSHVPCKKLSKGEIKLSTKAWINKDILAKIKYRDKLYSQVIKSKQPSRKLISIYKNFRNSVVKDIKASKSLYLKNTSSHIGLI